ncbi:MAG: family 1 encapsulin nanocompartment shell protein [Gemmatimonadaceae bacterium]
MADSNTQLQWTDHQWNLVRQVVYEEARRARVAGNVLPLYGPLDPDATYVSKEVLVDPGVSDEPGGEVPGFTVSDTDTLKLSTLQVKVYLRAAQVADPELTSALIAFRRAANVLARLEDDIVFNGQESPNEGPKNKSERKGVPALWEVRGGQEMSGLLLLGKRKRKGGTVAVTKPREAQGLGNELVGAVSRAVGDLEGRYHLGPFACILDQEYFNAVQTPNESSLVLPQDRILPFLGGGALLRSSVLPPNSGLVVALGGAPIDLVVATDISVNFLQVTTDPWFVFRVYEKIVLRVNQPDAIVALEPADAVDA